MTLGPVRKLMAITAVSRELSESSDAEDALQLLMRESSAFALDASVFSTAAATSAQPAGLLAGVAALTPATVTAGKEAAMNDDLSSLSAAIAPVCAGLTYIGNPSQINSIKIRKGTAWDPSIPLIATIAVPAGTIIALDPAAVVSTFDPTPEFRAIKEASVVFDDSIPGPIITGGQPAESLFQADAIGLQLRLRCAWALRVPGSIAWMNAVTW